MGIQYVMPTGDNKAVAASVAQVLGMDDYLANVPPASKTNKMREVKQPGLTVAMVGDGVNDASAPVQAELGIAESAGTNFAIESADIVLVRSAPRDGAPILALSGATYRKIVQNLWCAKGCNAGGRDSPRMLCERNLRTP